jgi:HlyD family secretion protein
MKTFLSIVVVLGVSASGWYLWKNSPAANAESRTFHRPTTAVVEARDISFAVNAAGDIGPADQVSVRPEVNGRIEELPVDIGDPVKKGDLLCRLDDRDLQIELKQRSAEIEGAKLQLIKAERIYERLKQLVADKLVSQEEYDNGKTEYQLATNSVDRALQALRLVEDRLRKTRIVAPFDCTVLTRPVSLGQTVSGAAGFNSGTEIMTIANLNDMIVNAHINQADVIRLQQGREVDIQAESVAGVKMKGVVERIAPQAVIKNGIKGFSVRIAIKSIDARVRPGMSAILNIPVSSADNVLAVPLAAVFSENGERFVFVKTEEKTERRPVVIGVADYAYAEVIEGLTAGEIVALDQTVNATVPNPAGGPFDRGAERRGKMEGARAGGSSGGASREGAGNRREGADRRETGGRRESGSSGSSAPPSGRPAS